MANKKSTAEEELEKQYQDYKAQFIQWKARNRDSVGTDAYIKYVLQFENWEKDVEKRRAAIRQKAEIERLEREVQSKRELEKKQAEEAAARAYAEQQSSYLAMHQQAMEEQSQQRQSQFQQQQQQLLQAKNSPRIEIKVESGLSRPVIMGQSIQPQQQRSSFPLVNNQQQQQPQMQVPTIGQSGGQSQEVSSMVNVWSQMLACMMKQENATEDKFTPKPQPPPNMGLPSVPAPQQSTSTGEPSAPPQLWGSDGAAYPVNDPMFRKWNVRAAPPNFRAAYQPPPPGTPITPGWLVLKTMQERKLVFAQPKNAIPSLMGVNGGGNLAAQPLPTFSVPPPNFGAPPPGLFKLA